MSEWKQNNEIDTRKLLLSLLRLWPFTILLIILFGIIAFLYNRYTPNTYSVKASILVDRQNNQFDPSNILFDNTDLGYGDNKVIDDLIILKSFPMLKQVISELNLTVDYYRITDRLKRFVQVYGEQPIVITRSPESNGRGLDGIFTIEIIDDTSFRLEHNNGYQIEPSYNWDQTIEIDGVRFVISKNDSIEFDHAPRTYGFSINSLDQVTFNYAHRLTCQPQEQESSIIELTLQGAVPELDIAFLNQLIKRYIENNLREKNQVASNTILFINEQLTSIEDSLKSVEANLQAFKSSNKISDLSVEGEKFFQQLLDLEEERARILLQEKYLEYLQEFLENATVDDPLVAPSAMGITDPNVNEITNEIIGLQTQRRMLVSQNNGKSPVVKQLASRIKELQNTLRDNVKGALSTSNILKKDIDSRISKVETLVRKLPVSEIQLIDIQRLYKLNEELFILFMEKRAEAEITRSSNTPDIKIVEPGRLALLNPISPNPKFAYILVGVLSILLPVLLFLLLDFFDNKIKTKEDLASLNDTPFLGYVMSAKDKPKFFIMDQPKSAVAESFRTLRSNLRFLVGKGHKKVIVISSILPGEGKTFISANLAMSLSTGDNKILVIGADLRKPRLFDAFEIGESSGLSNYLAEDTSNAAIIRPSKFKNIDIITSGPVPPNPLELLEKKKMNQLIEEQKEHYDYIIIDTPPVGLVSDMISLLPLADLAIMAVRSGHSKKESLEVINDLSRKHPKEKIGVVINYFDSVHTYGYGNGYGNSYGYYEQDRSKSSFLSRIKALFIFPQ